MRTIIFVILFGVIFAFSTLSNQGGSFGLGVTIFTSYGWPRPWLHVQVRDTRNSLWLNGQVQPGERTTRLERIDPSSLTLSVATSAGLAGVSMLPLLFVTRKSESEGNNSTTA